MLESEIENHNGDVWLQYHGNVWFCCGNDFSSGQCLVVLRLHHRRITLNAVQLGQYFFEFPAD